MVAGGLGAQYEYFSAQVEVKAFDATRANWIESLNLEAEIRKIFVDFTANMQTITVRRIACPLEWKLRKCNLSFIRHAVSSVPHPRIVPNPCK